MQTMCWNMPKPSHCKPAIDTLIVSFIWLQQRMGEREKINLWWQRHACLVVDWLLQKKKNEKSSVNRAMIKSKSVSYSTFSSIPRRPRHALDATVYANCYLMLTLAPNSTELNDNGGELVESWGSAFQLIEIMSPTHTHTHRIDTGYGGECESAHPVASSPNLQNPPLCLCWHRVVDGV